MHIDFPYRVAPDRCTARAGEADHVRDMIEQLLFTNLRERVMRPDYGAGCLQYVFAPNSLELAATFQATLQAAMSRWLGDLIDVKQVAVEAVEAELRVTVCYVLRASGEVRHEAFTRPAL
jgi:uncharacterized protein